MNPIGQHNYSIALALPCQCVRCLQRVRLTLTKYKALGNFIVKFSGLIFKRTQAYAAQSEESMDIN